MARAITLGNGNVLVGLDRSGLVRDFYYPLVGQTNHVSGASGSFVHRIGVYVDGVLSWLDESVWVVTFDTLSTSAIGKFTATHEAFGIVLSFTDAVHNEEDVFLRDIVVTNTAKTVREVKVFFSQQFRIGESRRGDTALFDPRVKAIIHYKGKDTFLINAQCNGMQFTEYNIGLFGIEGKEGTWHDAYDGALEKNPIEHGSVDSVIGFTMTLEARSSANIEYWIVAAPSIPRAHALDELVLNETPKRLIASTDAYWEAWLQKEHRDMSALPAEVQQLYRRSLATIRVHTDNRGGMIASSDTDMLHHGRDTYSYVWPRDGAMIAYALDQVGYQDVAERFFSFIAECQEPAGFFMHKYLPDGSLGSSWHPWMQQGQPYLPIQEDETASILFALWHHYEVSRDLEFIETHYNTCIEPAAQFLTEYIEAATGLPQASFDLWEEKYGTSTYTAASVYGGLMAAYRFAGLLGKDNDARTYLAVAQRLQTAITTHLYDDKLGMFVKHVRHTDDGLVYDKTLDVSSFYGLMLFGVLPVDDPRMITSLKTIESRLSVQASSQGFVRYERDTYYTMQEAGSPNPWVITTLWVARYYIEAARTKKDLASAFSILTWTASHAIGAGTLAEQMHPHTREHKSASPLIWSHAEFVLAVDAYLRKLESFA